MTKNPVSFDRLDVIAEYIRANKRVKPLIEEEDELFDLIEDMLILSYVEGLEQSRDVVPTAEVYADALDRAINKRVAGKTYAERAKEHILMDDDEALIRLIETEAIRDYNAGVYDAAEQYLKSQQKKASEADQQARDEEPKNVMKMWVTMGDEKVRDTHRYIDGVVIPVGDNFVTCDGDEALYPGGFELPENNINCRCHIELVTA